VKAKEDRGGGFGEHAAVQIAADEEDGDSFEMRAERRTEKNGQVRSQRRGGRGTIQYQGRKKLRVES
jgi:hypothetical protein